MALAFQHSSTRFRVFPITHSRLRCRVCTMCVCWKSPSEQMTECARRGLGPLFPGGSG